MIENDDIGFKCFSCGELDIECCCPDREEDQDD